MQVRCFTVIAYCGEDIIIHTSLLTFISYRHQYKYDMKKYANFGASTHLQVFCKKQHGTHGQFSGGRGCSHLMHPLGYVKARYLLFEKCHRLPISYFATDTKTII